VHRCVLLFCSDGAWRLPYLEEVPDRGWTLPDFGLQTPRTEDAFAVLRERLGLVVTLLQVVDVEDPDPAGLSRLVALENHSPNWAPPEGGRWVGREALEELALQRPIEQAALASWFTETGDVGRREPLMPWWRPGWFQEAMAWAAAELHQRGIRPSGSPKPVKNWYRSCVLQLETDAGAVFFKASPRAFAHEAALTLWLAKQAPACVPTLLAADLDRGWTLTLDVGGVSLREVQEVAVWEEALRAYTRLQIASGSQVDELLALGCLDLRLERLAEQVDVFFSELPWLLQGSPDRLTPDEMLALRSLVPRLQEACKMASDCGMTSALEHGDFHAVNVAVTATGPVFIDWGEGCIPHPFFSLISMLHDSVALPAEADARTCLQDAYLSEWEQHTSSDRCPQHVASLRPLYALHRAFQDRGQLAALWEQLGSRPLLPLTAAEWSIRERQRWLAERLRALLCCFLNN
jgi:aminoglycoside/choline kinase family phosphotransferase